MPDKYGIPEGGNNGAWSAKNWAGISHTLSWKEMIATVALGGWPESKWAEAAATASAESGRNPFIYNTYRLGHFGLFQISRSAHPQFFAPSGHGMAWVVPPENAKEGYRIYKAQGWGAWEAHSKGLHLAFLAQARAAVAAVKAGGTGAAYWQSLYTTKTRELIFKAAAAGNPGAINEAIGGALFPGIEAGAVGTADMVQASGDAVAGAVGDMAQVVSGVWESLTTPAFWMRVGYGALGVVLVAGGLFLIVRTTPAAAAAGKAVSAVPVARAVKKGT